jgi:hypothetical protein
MGRVTSGLLREGSATVVFSTLHVAMEGERVFHQLLQTAPKGEHRVGYSTFRVRAAELLNRRRGSGGIVSSVKCATVLADALVHKRVASETIRKLDTLVVIAAIGMRVEGCVTTPHMPEQSGSGNVHACMQYCRSVVHRHARTRGKHNRAGCDDGRQYPG